MTPSLSQLTITEFLARLASDMPTPGGGVVAALTGALAAGLGEMVCAFTLGRPKFAAVAPQIQVLQRRLSRAGELFRGLMDEDAAAYEVLRAALATDRTVPQRPERVTQAAALAGTVPLETATLCRQVLTDLESLQRVGNPLLASDAEAATHLAHAAAQAAAANVRANLPLMSDADARRISEQLGASPQP